MKKLLDQHYFVQNSDAEEQSPAAMQKRYPKEKQTSLRSRKGRLSNWISQPQLPL